uniref:Uncharacterized protein n=1 Tax=viral metagenome TaxID=1070528 RepID=A0A6M3KA98_9ZZZZ
MGQIYLRKKDACLILGDKGRLLLGLPALEDDEDVPDHVTYLAMLACLIKSVDKGFGRYITKRYKEILRAMSEDNEAK